MVLARLSHVNRRLCPCEDRKRWPQGFYTAQRLHSVGVQVNLEDAHRDREAGYKGWWSILHNSLMSGLIH